MLGPHFHRPMLNTNWWTEIMFFYSRLTLSFHFGEKTDDICGSTILTTYHTLLSLWSGSRENGGSPTGPIPVITTVNNFKGTPNAYNDLTSQGNLGPHSRTLAAVSRDPKSSGTAVVSLADANIGNNLSIESMASATIFLLLNYLLL